MSHQEQVVVLVVDDARGVLVNGAPQQSITFVVRDDSKGHCPDTLKFDLSHVTNKNFVMQLDPTLLAAYPHLASSLRLTGTPGYPNAVYTLHAEPCIFEGLATIVVLYAASQIKIKLSSDYNTGLENHGNIKCASLKVADGINAYPQTDTNGKATMTINNRAPTSSRHIKVGDEKTLSDVYNIQCRDTGNKTRMQVDADKVKLNGTVECVISGSESVSYISPAGNAVYRVDSNGNVFATSYVAMSDSRMKCNICELEERDAIQAIRQLNCYSYNFCVGDQKRHYGLLADDVAQILPDIVRGTRETQRSIVYDELIPHLIAAVKKIDKDHQNEDKKICCTLAVIILSGFIGCIPCLINY